MRMTPHTLLFSTALMSGLIITPLAAATEGMYTPDQLPEIAKDLRKKGLKLNPNQISDLTGFPMGAVVSLGGCTASFVSPQGLVVTNHHCAYGSIQYNSTEDNNYLDNGFLAQAMDDELPAAPGSRIYVTTDLTDVTLRVTGGLSDDLTGADRYAAIDDNRKAIVAECEADEGHRCNVSSFYGGLQYKLIKSLEIKDVRLVYAPAGPIGKYGGDIDNWQWPRHTGDFSFYRGYVSPEGKSADFAEENVPYTPPHMLKVSAGGLDEGDFVMVAGYPGRTSRYARLTEVENTFGWEYPTWITMLEDWIGAIKDTSAEGSDARIKYESRLAGLNNYMKNLGGQIEGARRVGLVDRRRAREAALNSWIAAEAPDAGYAEAIADLDILTRETAFANRQNHWYRNATRPQMLGAAKRLYRLSKESQKPDAQRETGYQERDLDRIKESLTAIDRRYDAAVDKAEWMMFLKGYMAQPAEQRVAAFDTALGLNDGMSAQAISDKLDMYYANTALSDKETRLSLMTATPEELEASADPFMTLAVALFEQNKAMEDASKARSGRYAVLEPKYMEAIIAWQKSQGMTAYPDANSTLRVTYGNVMGGSPKDGMSYMPFTTVEGIVEKDTTEDPFNSPQKQLDLIKAQDYGRYALKSIGSVPVNFLTDLDSTGGNSGSATLNARGELVGLLFDGTIESVNSDWDFDPRTTRSIHVDSRYMLWVMEKVDGADRLLNEMDIVGK
ncbi:S46 family peptidase [Robiginitomaculum antarcticum]|uniref:S46 family peptidase n=1 Tax=Robiginitomaculum antarcticum TaxID=437507 RepID=UPI0003AB237D|nr:S46 family peptidase [Robiginitomaculum antarcticum]